MSSQHHWEYLVLQMRMTGNEVADNEARLNKLGFQAWEIVAVAATDATHTIYLKRRA